MRFSASLLQLRGDTPCSLTPLHDTSSGDILCYNGEIFGGLEVVPGQNDGIALLHALITSTGTKALQACRYHHNPMSYVIFLPSNSHQFMTLYDILLSVFDPTDVPCLLSRLRGPWSVIYWRNSTQTLWFGRDVMGEHQSA
jgi:asparagine synthetase B (glutamine-hydrolysing)